MKIIDTLKIILADEINRIIFFALVAGILFFGLNTFLLPEISFFISVFTSTILNDYIRTNKLWNITIFPEIKKENLIYSVLIAIFNIILIILLLFISGSNLYLQFDKFSIFSIQIIFLMLMSATAEEYAFRGILFQSIKDKFGSLIAVLITSFLFASGHFFNSNFNEIAFINTFIAGVLYSLIILNTNNIIYSIILHFIWNFSLVFLLNSPVSGFNYDLSLIQIILPINILFGNQYGIESGLITLFILFLNIDLTFRLLKESPFITSKLFYRKYEECKLRSNK